MRFDDLPNLITIGRLLLVGPVVWALLQQRFELALLLFVVAGLSDGLDGFLAKRYGWQSEVGAVLDPLADKALLVSVYLCLGMLGLVPVWLVIAIIVRDVVIVFGAVGYYFRIAAVPMTPMWVSKLNTVLQILLALMIVYRQVFGGFSGATVEFCIWLVLVSTIVSGLAYVWVWGMKAKQAMGSE